MTTPPLRRLVSPRRSNSTSSISDNDDDSIGPLPVLKRNKSLVVQRATRTASGQESGRKLAREKRPDSATSTRRPPVRRRSIDTPPSHYFSSGSRHLVETSERADFNEDDNVPVHLPSPPRRARSLQAANNPNIQQALLEQCQQVSKRRALVQPGAATRLSLSKRPDPPEQIRPGMATESPRKGVLVTKSSKKAVLGDPIYRSKSLKAPSRPRRTVSMPLFGRSPVQKHSSKPKKDRDGDPIAKSRDGLFSAARRSHSIAKSFARGKGLCNDVWVERMVVRDGKDPQVFFKSVFSKECKSEPPTGALNVIYMDELVKVQHLTAGRTHRLSKHKEEEIVAISPVVKKRSLWGKPRKSKRSAEPSSPSNRVRTWKSIGLGAGSRHKKKGNAS